MRKHIYFAAAILASLASCADDVFESQSMPGVEGQTEMLSQDFTLGVALNLNDPTTRADFAGATGSTNPFQNVYFEPEFSSNALNPTDVSTVRGDQVGLCLVNGSNAVTNIPFFIAGYESNARLQNSDAPKQIYPLKADNTAGSLYYLGAANGGSTTATKIDYTSGLALGSNQAWHGANDEASFNTLVSYVTDGSIKAANTDCPDVTKGLFKAPFPVMTGKYFAYFPFDKNFLTQGEIPVTELTQFANQTTYGNKNNVQIFAYSSKIQNFDNSKVSGQFVLDKNLAMIMQINLQNYATVAPNAVTPNLVTMTVEDAEGNPQEAFALNGTIGFEGENAKFVPGDKKSNIMGVSLNGTTGVAIAGATTASDNIVYLPIYPVGGVEGTIVIRIYTATADGQQVYTYKLNNVTGSALTAGSNLAPRITINLADLTPEVATPLVYNAETFESALSKGSSTEATTIQLLGNIDYNRAFPAGITDKSYIVKGGSVKFSNASSLTSNAPKNMTFECPVELASPLTISEGNTWTFNDVLTISASQGLNVVGNLVADDITVKAGAQLKLGDGSAIANITAETITNNGTFNAKQGVLSVTEAIDNNGTLNVGETAALTLKVAAINNAKDKTLNWYNSEMATGLTITNEGTLAIANADGINFNGATLTNNGDVVLDATSAATRLNVNTGTITNNGNIEVTSVSGNAATLAIINSVFFTNNSRIIDNGQVYGQNFVTNGVDAEFIRVVSSAADFQAANLIKAYTTIQVGGAIISGLTNLNVTKNLILNANLTMTGSCKNISVENDAILTSSALEVDGNITIAAGKTLTIGDNSFINVSGKIETLANNGTYGDFKFNSTAPETRPSVIANDIVTNGANWTSYPVYGNN